jgi:hypothetical protein
MNGDKFYSSSSSNKFICCEIANCKNKATDIIDEQLTDAADDIGNVYLCRRCKEGW